MADIGRHYESIKHWIPDGEKEAFQERMADCIEDETAWCLGEAFLYYSKIDKRISHGIALFGRQDNTDLLALFAGVFSLEDNDTHHMRFKLHPGKFMDEYKSLLTVISMKRCHRDPDHPLMVPVQKLREKFVKILSMEK